MKITVYGEGWRCKIYELTREQAERLRTDSRIGEALLDMKHNWTDSDSEYAERLFDEASVKLVFDKTVYDSNLSTIHIEDQNSDWGSWVLSLEDVVTDFVDKVKVRYESSFTGSSECFRYSVTELEEKLLYESSNPREKFNMKKLKATYHEIDFESIGITVDAYGSCQLVNADQSIVKYRRMNIVTDANPTSAY